MKQALALLILFLNAGIAGAQTADEKSAVAFIESLYQVHPLQLVGGEFNGHLDHAKQCDLLRKYFVENLINKKCDGYWMQYPGDNGEDWSDFKGNANYDSLPETQVGKIAILGGKAIVPVQIKRKWRDAQTVYFLAKTNQGWRIENAMKLRNGPEKNSNNRDCFDYGLEYIAKPTPEQRQYEPKVCQSKMDPALESHSDWPPAYPYAASLTLSCRWEAPNQLERKRILEKADGVVARTAKHELQVVANGKIHRFVDQAPYDEPGGQHYEFCDRRDGFILLIDHDNSIITGKLINENTGLITPGGEDIYFSADRRAYFTTEQPDGLDGSVWKIYFINGVESWSGYNFIKSDNPSGRHFYSASLSDPKWEQNGEFSAIASCASNFETKWKVKLVNTTGKWDWRPKRKCSD